MKVKKIFAVVLAVVMICALAASCNFQIGHSDSIVGKWKNIDAKDSSGFFIFEEDGTLTIEGLNYTIDCTYTVDGDTLEIEYLNTVYTDYNDNETDFGKPGFYSSFNEKTKMPSGGVKNLEHFSGKYMIFEQSNKDYLEIFYIDPNSSESMTVNGKEIKGAVLKWRYERSYEGTN